MGGPTGLNPMDLCGTLTGMHGKYSLLFCSYVVKAVLFEHSKNWKGEIPTDLIRS